MANKIIATPENPNGNVVALTAEEETQTLDGSVDDKTFSFVGELQEHYTIRVRIDYSVGAGVFESRDFVVINL